VVRVPAEGHWPLGPTVGANEQLGLLKRIAGVGDPRRGLWISEYALEINHDQGGTPQGGEVAMSCKRQLGKSRRHDHPYAKVWVARIGLEHDRVRPPLADAARQVNRLRAMAPLAGRAPGPPMLRMSSMPRPTCSVFIATSVDGCIARSNGGLDWLAMVERDGEDYGYAKFFSEVDTVVLGSNTYRAVLGLGEWPYSGKRCVVLTHRAAEPCHQEQFRSGPPDEIVRELQSEGARRIYVDGGEVIRQFMAAGLVDDLTVSVVPIVLGGGIRLWDGQIGETMLVLEQVRSWPSGLIQQRYAVVR